MESVACVLLLLLLSQQYIACIVYICMNLWTPLNRWSAGSLPLCTRCCCLPACLRACDCAHTTTMWRLQYSPPPPPSGTFWLSVYGKRLDSTLGFDVNSWVSMFIRTLLHVSMLWNDKRNARVSVYSIYSSYKIVYFFHFVRSSQSRHHRWFVYCYFFPSNKTTKRYKNMWNYCLVNKKVAQKQK